MQGQSQADTCPWSAHNNRGHGFAPILDNASFGKSYLSVRFQTADCNAAVWLSKSE